MKQPKLKLKELEIQSFVTKLSYKNKQTLLGGDPTDTDEGSVDSIDTDLTNKEYLCETVTSTGVVVGRRGGV